MSHAVLFRTKSKTPYRKHLLHRGTASRRCVATRPPQQPKHGTICPHARTVSTFGSCRDVRFFATPCRFPQNHHLSSHIIHELSSHFNPLILRIVSRPAECAAAGSCTTPCRLHALIHLVPAPSRLHTRTHRWRKGRSARRALHHFSTVSLQYSPFRHRLFNYTIVYGNSNNKNRNRLPIIAPPAAAIQKMFRAVPGTFWLFSYSPALRRVSPAAPPAPAPAARSFPSRCRDR